MPALSEVYSIIMLYFPGAVCLMSCQEQRCYLLAWLGQQPTIQVNHCNDYILSCTLSYVKTPLAFKNANNGWPAKL